jgi:hypothetical protein
MSARKKLNFILPSLQQKINSVSTESPQGDENIFGELNFTLEANLGYKSGARWRVLLKVDGQCLTSPFLRLREESVNIDMTKQLR